MLAVVTERNETRSARLAAQRPSPSAHPDPRAILSAKRTWCARVHAHSVPFPGKHGNFRTSSQEKKTHVPSVDTFDY